MMHMGVIMHVDMPMFSTGAKEIQNLLHEKSSQHKNADLQKMLPLQEKLRQNMYDGNAK